MAKPKPGMDNRAYRARCYIGDGAGGYDVWHIADVISWLAPGDNLHPQDIRDAARVMVASRTLRHVRPGVYEWTNVYQ